MTKHYLHAKAPKSQCLNTIPSAHRTKFMLLTGRSPGLTDIQYHRCGGSVRILH